MPMIKNCKTINFESDQLHLRLYQLEIAKNTDEVKSIKENFLLLINFCLLMADFGEKHDVQTQYPGQTHLGLSVDQPNLSFIYYARIIQVLNASI